MYLTQERQCLHYLVGTSSEGTSDRERPNMVGKQVVAMDQFMKLQEYCNTNM